MRIVKIILLECIFIISFTLFAEFIGRVYFYLKHGYTLKESFLYENDKDLIYKINPVYKGEQGKYYLGMREDYFDKDKGNKIRIICMGGSVTFGHSHLDNLKVWPKALGRLLNKGLVYKKYEVLNAGVAGYGSSNILARLKKEILSLHPDILIVYDGWNLVGSVKSKYAWVPDNITTFKKQPFLKRVSNFFTNNSILYIKLEQLIVNHLTGPMSRDRMEEAVNKIYPSELPILEGDFKEIVKICKSNGVIPVLIKYPTRDYDYKRYADTIKVIEKVACETNTYLIDCSSWFKSLNEEDRAGYFTDIAHSSEEGDEKIAQLICAGLIDKGVIRSKQ